LYFTLFYHVFYRITVIGWSALAVVSRYTQILLLLSLTPILYFISPASRPHNTKNILKYKRHLDSASQRPAAVLSSPNKRILHCIWHIRTHITLSGRAV